MVDLNQTITRLEMRAEQMVIYLRSTDRDSKTAHVMRLSLLGLLHTLRYYKDQREQLLAA